ncbi:MAG: threonine--tRNA ligase [Candidatus Gribaldobacteria bacterium]|nr:threonine--tRNA ligase [Candidatus Gribaldobacteria bacterium]
MEQNIKDIEIARHSLSHIMAMAVQKLYPEVKFGIGPAIENGFYYDFDFSDTKITPEDLSKIEKEMRAIIRQNIDFIKKEISQAEAEKLFADQPYKLELIKQLGEGQTFQISTYQSGDFVDLCAGPHIENTKEINAKAFKLTKLAGAYWRGDEKRPMLTRIYGLAFAIEKELTDYLQMMEEAEKRDHRKLGKELDLFIFSELVGPGLPLYTPKGFTILNQITDYSRKLNESIGYQEVHTPNMNKAELFKVSGHYEKYKEDMFQVVSNYTKEEYFLKPMNCPQHTQIYASKTRSYRDLPVRIADFANLYRDERPGELSGLTRLRAFRQDDGHCFCAPEQIKDEFKAVLTVVQEAMAVYKMNYKIRFSLWDPNNPSKYLGDKTVWEKSQKILEEILIENKVDYFRAEGEAAIYGPKMDLIAKDSISREWQLSTIQLDLIMPERFGLKYINKDGQEKTPIMIHRALTGSPERFLAILIEHYAGAFPVWLSPIQAIILPIGESHQKYGQEVLDLLKQNNIRAALNSDNDTIGKKIRSAEMQKIPYLLVVGDKEISAKSVAVRSHNETLGTMTVDKFIAKIKEEIINKK